MNICVIGVGRMGRRHISAAQGLGFQVTGIHDADAESLRIAEIENGISHELVFDTAEEMLKTVRPNGVVISTTSPSHCDYVCLAASVGIKYILCEKPMASSIAECDQMIEACSRADSVLAINHQMRFMEQFRRVKPLCESPQFGGVRSVTVAASNFGLAMNGSHYFEMFRYVAGSQLTEVSFMRDAGQVMNPRGAQFEDHSGQLFARNSEGQRLYMEIGGDQGHGVHIVYGCRLGQIFLDELSGYVRAVARKEEFRDLPTTRYGMPGDEKDLRLEPADVIVATQDVWMSMIEGADFPDGLCGRHTVEALVAANLSGESMGKWLSINGALPRERIFGWA